MALLQIRNYPDEDYAVLAELAASEHRSIAQQTRLLIKQGISSGKSASKQRRDEALRRLWSSDVFEGTPRFDAVQAVREDRER